MRDDRLLWITAAALAPLGVLSIVFGALLFIFPDRTDTLFAWTIAPPMSAAFVGASYLFGGVVVFHLLWLRKWHPLKVGLPGTWVFSTAMLGATLLHWDRFHQGSPGVYVWLAIYVVLPFALPAVYWLNQRHDPPPAPDEVVLSKTLRIIMSLAGLVYAAIGLILFVSPATIAPWWGWSLTPLMSRILGGWFMLPGVAVLAAARDARYGAMRPFVLDIIVWQVLLLAASLLHSNDFDFAKPLTWVWVGSLVTALMLTLSLYFYHERLAQAPRVSHEGQPIAAGLTETMPPK